MSATFQLDRDSLGQLVLIDAAGRRQAGVVPIRTFPMSDPEHWISICDSSGHEIFSVADLAELAPAARQMLEAELAQREFIPIIRRIIAASFEEPSQWQVETDRGATSFQVSTEDDVRRADSHQVSVVDSHCVRYLIPDMRQLDGTSRRLLEHFLG
jgi:hypothetical protein